MSRTIPFAIIDRLDHLGREFHNFHPCKNPLGTGYVILGGTKGGEYGGALVKVCATRVKPRKRGGRPLPVGWRSRLEAQQFANYLNDVDGRPAPYLQ